MVERTVIYRYRQAGAKTWNYAAAIVTREDGDRPIDRGRVQRALSNLTGTHYVEVLGGYGELPRVRLRREGQDHAPREHDAEGW